MSTIGAIEEALHEFDLSSERVGYALQQSNQRTATETQLAAAQLASQDRDQKRTKLLQAIHEHAAAQHQAGLEMGRAEAHRA